ncbi:hypothetical protein QUA40_13705, partial [Microcoleus sp. Pol11C3]|uniref:hypothetical protein n=1 Tax=Microcoleus sp. Pol11C3 TaxID=3055390 RepID=UPI002FD5E48F
LALYSRSRAQNPGYLKCDRYIQQALNNKSSRSRLKLGRPVLTVSWGVRRAIAADAIFLVKRIARVQQRQKRRYDVILCQVNYHQ